MPELIPVLDQDAIAQKVADIARQISSDYADADLVVIGVLKGAFIFMADLIRQLDVKHVAIDFVRVSSYGCGSETTGCIRLDRDVELDIRDKDVLIVEDILDSGLTLAYLLKHLRRYQPRSLKVCTMIEKRKRRQVEMPVDYVGYTVESGFLVGYGLDYAEDYRNLPGIFDLKM